MITLASVTKKYGAFVAVNNVSYTVERGEFFALLGPNGAGKTTIVRMLLGLSRPTAGTITIHSTPAGTPRVRRRIGYCAELLRIPPFLSGHEYLMRHAALAGFGRKEAGTEVMRVLDIVGMRPEAKKRSAAYSKGMVQRLGLAAAMIGTPELLVLDEPVSGLDPLGIRDVRNILAGLRDRGTTIILNSHLLSEVEKTCDTAAIMYNGRIVVKDRINGIVKGDETLEDVFIRYIENEHE